MAKFSGKIGFAIISEGAAGVYSESIQTKNYSGDVLQNNRRWEKSENLNDNLNINNKISIIADPFAYQNLGTMRYVEWMGASWKITNVEIQRPRLILTIGGVYNGPKN